MLIIFSIKNFEAIVSSPAIEYRIVTKGKEVISSPQPSIYNKDTTANNNQVQTFLFMIALRTLITRRSNPKTIIES
jgi:hypothetical protein